jgi:hypothetical protein
VPHQGEAGAEKAGHAHLGVQRRREAAVALAAQFRHEHGADASLLRFHHQAGIDQRHEGRARPAVPQQLTQKMVAVPRRP